MAYYAYYEGKIIEITIGKSNSPIKQQLVPSEEARTMIRKFILDDLNLLQEKMGIGAYLCQL